MRVLITGASGQLGSYLLRQLGHSGVETIAWSGSRSGELAGVKLQLVDLADPVCIVAAFRAARPTVVIHTAAMSSVVECHRHPVRARQVNAVASGVLADLAAQSATKLVLVSTDLVFDGARSWYREQDSPAPVSLYGRSKFEAEQAVQRIPRSVVARVSLLYGPTRVSRPAFFDQQVAALRERRPLTLFEDEWRTPLDLTTAAQALVAVAQSDYAGILHIGGPERMSRLEMGQRLAKSLGADLSMIVPVSRSTVAAAEPRPRDVSLDASRWRGLFPECSWPTFEQAIQTLGDRME